MTDDAWANFIASIDRTALESERMRVHGDLHTERFGSRQHWEMVHAHEWLKDHRSEVQQNAEPKPATVATNLRPVSSDEWSTALHEAAEWNERQRQSRRTRDAANQQYKQQRNAARAARKAA